MLRRAFHFSRVFAVHRPKFANRPAACNAVSRRGPWGRGRPAFSTSTPSNDTNQEKVVEGKSAKSQEKQIRLNRRIADGLLCSRRDAETLLSQGRVLVNGKPPTKGTVVKGDVVTVDKKVVPHKQKRPRMWIANKLAGELVSHSDPAGRPVIMDRFIQMGLPRGLKYIGRLDFNTQGLLLLTNSSRIANAMENPRSGLKRQYVACVRGKVSVPWLKSLQNGITIEGMRYRPVQAKVLKEQGKKTWLELTVSEGKNRELRRILGHMRLHVVELHRIRFGPYFLGDLPPGAAREVKVQNSILKLLAPTQDS